MSSNVPEESLQLKRVGLISFLITELHLLRVCNPLARSAGVFKTFWKSGTFINVLRKSGTFIKVLRKSGTFIKLLRRFKEIWNIHQRFKEICAVWRRRSSWESHTSATSSVGSRSKCFEGFWNVLNAFGRFWTRTLAEFPCQKNHQLKRVSF